jgi:hypothetical protein
VSTESNSGWWRRPFLFSGNGALAWDQQLIYGLIVIPKELLGSMNPCAGATGLSKRTKSNTMFSAAWSQTPLLLVIRGVNSASASNFWATCGSDNRSFCCFCEWDPGARVTGLAAKLLGRLTLLWVGKNIVPIGVLFSVEFLLGSGVNDRFRHSSSPELLI